VSEAPTKEKNGKLRTALIGGLKHLGIPAVVAGLLVTAGLNWLERKNQEFEDTRKAVNSLQTELEILKSKAATDNAQWRALRRFNDKLDPLSADVKAYGILLDKILDDTIQVRGEPKKKEKEGLAEKLDKLLGRHKEPPVVVRRAPLKAPQSVKQYQEQEEEDYRQEQMQQQAPLK